MDSWVHRVPENGHQPLGRGNSLWRSACPILWSNPILLRYFTKIAPSVLPCPKTQEHQGSCVDSWVHRVPENGHQPLGRGNSLWRSACPILWWDPFCYAISRRLTPLCSLALRLRNTKVPVWTHESIGYPKIDISHCDEAIHYGVQLAQYCDQTLSCYAISRRLPPLCSRALRLRNTKVPVWTHESIGYPKMDISHWDAAIHYGVQLAQYCDQTLSCYAISRRFVPSVLPCPMTQEHQSTCVDSWLHRVPENGHQPLGRGNSLWRSACQIMWSNPILLRYFTKIAPSVLPCPKTQEHQSTCVDSWVHRVPENGHQPLGRGSSLWRSACPILWSNPLV